MGRYSQKYKAGSVQSRISRTSNITVDQRLKGPMASRETMIIPSAIETEKAVIIRKRNAIRLAGWRDMPRSPCLISEIHPGVLIDERLSEVIQRSPHYRFCQTVDAIPLAPRISLAFFS
jgi:hypothetical protein